MPRVFVFGALMRSAPGRTGGTAARITDHEVAFVARGIRFIEPAFAALVVAPGKVAHGVLYDVDDTEWARLCAREPGYLPVRVTAEANGRAHQAVALRICDAERLGTPRPPSRRYARLLLEGARQHALPSEWIEQLSHLERTGPRFTARFSFLMKVVAALIPYLGPRGALAVVALGALASLVGLGGLVVWAVGRIPT